MRQAHLRLLWMMAALTWPGFTGALLAPALAQEPATARAAVARAEAAGGSPSRDDPLWATALTQLEAAARQHPDDSDTLRLLAESYGRVGWWIRAWEAWRAFRLAGGDLDPEAQAAVAHIGHQLAYARHASGDVDGAVAYYRAVLDLAPDDREGYVRLARIYQEAGQTDLAAAYREAVAAFGGTTEAKTVQSTSSDAFQRGLELYAQGQAYPARLAFVEATEAAPEHAEAWAWLGRTRYEQASYALAAQAYREAVRLMPDHPEYRARLAETSARIP